MRSLLAPLLLATLVGLVDPVETVAAGGPDRPNVLFIIFDDWGWNHAGAYGCSWVKTPNFDRVAREGILFKNAFTSNPKCSPCRASILTGRNSWQLEEAACHYGIFPRKFAVYPELLEAAGYTVGLTGKGWGPGDHQSTGFKRNPAGPLFDEHTTQPPASGIARTDYAKNFESFLGKRPAGQPFSFWMGFKEPHRGYERHSGTRLGKRPEDVKVPAYLPDLDVVRDDLLDYAVEVEYADAQIGKALQALENAGELERTLIIVTSDHGMPFPRVKGQIFEDGFHLPLAIRWGATIKPGRVVEDFVNVRDFAPTFLELAGLPPHPQITGKSLVNVLRSQASGWVDRDRNVMLAGKERHDLGRPYDWGYPARAIRTPEFLYVHNYFPDRWPAGNPETDFGNCDPSPTKELLKAIGGEFYEISFGKRPADALYRLTDDPECVRNLASDPAYTTVMATLRDQMVSMLRQEQDPRALGNGAIFESYKYVGPRAKGYDAWLKAHNPAPATVPVGDDDAPAKKTAKRKNQADAP
ncbi:Arylsulfatase A [Singulisphaera sp. GP187]|uniref:sulfatase family protein n=1 Tax=Singulisphaera sp. GP187 TaxID=1882752 RepID=UPI0009278BB6|nr:sulfatase [Singulisphaera sp. GP187]SIN71781.1 Arylsulfatase A [Singulisphaera sp. GP187]